MRLCGIEASRLPSERKSKMTAIPASDQHSLSTWQTSAAPLGGRALLAPLFLISGVGKLTAFTATIGYIGSVGLPFPELAYVGAVAVELIGGLMLLVGYRTRWVALALALFTLATAFLFHSALADQNQFIHFLKNIAVTGGLIQVAAFGAGRWSLDARRG